MNGRRLRPAEAAVAHQVLEIAHRVHAGEDVRARERNEPVRMALGEPGDQLVRDERLVHARELVEAGDQRTVDPRRSSAATTSRRPSSCRPRAPELAPGRAPACRRRAGSPPSPSGSDARHAPSPPAPARSAPTCRSRASPLMPLLAVARVDHSLQPSHSLLLLRDAEVEHRDPVGVHVSSLPSLLISSNVSSFRRCCELSDELCSTSSESSCAKNRDFVRNGWPTRKS